MLQLILTEIWPGALTIYTESPEILVGKWNYTYRSIWNISEITGYRGLIAAFFLFLLNFPIDTSTYSDFSNLRLDKLEHWIFTHKISTRMDGVNGKSPSSQVR